MFDYKVEYVYTTQKKSKWYEASKNTLNAWSLSKELEALLIEYDEKGFEPINISPINSYEAYAAGGLSGTKTDGLLVTFKKKPVLQ